MKKENARFNRIKHVILIPFFLISIFFANILIAQGDINSSVFGTLEARQLGPGTMSGRISAIEGVNSDDGKTLYIGT